MLGSPDRYRTHSSAMWSWPSTHGAARLHHFPRWCGSGAPLERRAGTCHQHHKAVPMTDSSHSMNLRGARPGVSVTQLRRRAMSTISRPRLKAQAFTDTLQVEIVDLTGIYVRKAGMKSAAILDGVEPCRVEEFAARHFRRSGFEATFLESEPFGVLFGVYLWSVIQDRGDRQVRTVGIMAHPGYAHGESSEVI